MKNFLLILFILFFGLASCNKNESEYPKEPQIYYLNTNPDKIRVSDPNQFISIQFRFTDGDQDIANNPDETDSTIFLRDSRDTSTLLYTYVYPMPYISPDLRPNGGLEGMVTLHLSNAYFSPRDSLHLALGKDTMVWLIYIKDNAGNKSNTIKSDTIYLNYH